MQGFVVAINLRVECCTVRCPQRIRIRCRLGRFVGERGLYHPCFGGVECDDSGR